MATDLLVDGDLFLYKASFGCEKEVVWDDENHVLWSNLEDAWGALQENFDGIPLPRDGEFIVALTGRNNFRKSLCETYKANRGTARKPLCYGELVDRVKENYRVVQYDGLEADDVLGILATRPSSSRRIIVSGDKDMRSVPCNLYAKGELVKITEEEADYNHMYQTLVGDQADGYPGCPGIGPVKAAKLLETDAGPSRWSRVVDAFKGDEEAALLQARLARILRDSDWDSEKKEPILWKPMDLTKT